MELWPRLGSVALACPRVPGPLTLLMIPAERGCRTRFVPRRFTPALQGGATYANPAINLNRSLRPKTSSWLHFLFRFSVPLLPEGQLLLESNGVLDEYQYGVIWPAEKIVGENRGYRTYPDFKLLYMPFDCLLFFGEEGNGDLYAYVVTEGAIRRPDVFLWEHETDSRQWYAARMQNYLEQRLASG